MTTVLLQSPFLVFNTYTQLDGPNLPIKLMVKSACQCVKEFIDTINENIIGPPKCGAIWVPYQIVFFFSRKIKYWAFLYCFLSIIALKTIAKIEER